MRYCAGVSNLPSKPAVPELSSGKSSLAVQYACPDVVDWTYTLTRVDTTPHVMLVSDLSAAVTRTTGTCTFTIPANPTLPSAHRVGQFKISLVSPAGLVGRRGQSLWLHAGRCLHSSPHAIASAL